MPHRLVKWFFVQHKDSKLTLGYWLSVLADGLGSFVLLCYALLIGPLGILRGPLAFERLFLYLWVLVPLRALTRTVRAGVDWRVGHFSLAIVQIESIVSVVHESYEQKSTSSKRRVLLDLYAVLTRAYMHAGDVDKAMQVILQAQKNIGVNRLPGLADLDAKTAHLIRAGIAAGRMLEGGGLATMFIKTDAKGPTSQGEASPTNPSKTGQTPKKGAKSKRGQVIPFPLR